MAAFFKRTLRCRTPAAEEGFGVEKNGLSCQGAIPLSLALCAPSLAEVGSLITSVVAGEPGGRYCFFDANENRIHKPRAIYQAKSQFLLSL